MSWSPRPRFQTLKPEFKAVAMAVSAEVWVRGEGDQREGADFETMRFMTKRLKSGCKISESSFHPGGIRPQLIQLADARADLYPNPDRLWNHPGPLLLFTVNYILKDVHKGSPRLILQTCCHTQHVWPTDTEERERMQERKS